MLYQYYYAETILDTTLIVQLVSTKENYEFNNLQKYLTCFRDKNQTMTFLNIRFSTPSIAGFQKKN